MSSDTMGTDELGALLKHTSEWVREQCRAGRLPHHKIGKRYVFTPDDVAQILTVTAVGARNQPSSPIVITRRGRYPRYRRTGTSQEVNRRDTRQAR